MNKSLQLLEALEKIRIWQLNGQRIVFTNGCFDILHVGHASLLHQASKLGSKLVVGLNSDRSIKLIKGKDRPFNNERDRAYMLSAFGMVDLIVFFDEQTPLNLITEIEPDVLVKGGDYSENLIVGADWVKNNGGQVVIVPLLEGYSTTKLIQKLTNF